MGKDYSNLGLTYRLQPENSLSATRPKRITGYEFDSLYEIQSRQLNASKINIEEFIRVSSAGTVLGTFSTSQTLSFSTTLGYVQPHTNSRMLAIPYVAFYQGAGTSAGSQIYPTRGTGVTLGRYDVQGAFDFAGWNGTSSTFRGIITDTNGTSTQSVTLATRWAFADYRTSPGE